MKYCLTLILLSLLQIFNDAQAQGCSDAGFCTIGHLKQSQATNGQQKHQSISVLLPLGIGDENVFVFSPGIQYDNQLNKRWGIQAKITGNYASGNLGNATGAGDIYLSGSYTIPTVKNWELSLTAGTKLPLNQGDLKVDGRSLPMQYQSSLGTIDLITGVSIVHRNWQFATGWQQPLSGINLNHFLPIYWNSEAASRYIPTNDFKRQGDVLLRISYLLPVHAKLSFNGGLLGIYHLGKDSYIDAAVSSKPIEIQGSDGLTLNATLATWYQVNDRVRIGVTGGVPLVVRDVRPDGLTREFVVAPEIRFNF